MGTLYLKCTSGFPIKMGDWTVYSLATTISFTFCSASYTIFLTSKRTSTTDQSDRNMVLLLPILRLFCDTVNTIGRLAKYKDVGKQWRLAVERKSFDGQSPVGTSPTLPTEDILPVYRVASGQQVPSCPNRAAGVQGPLHAVVYWMKSTVGLCFHVSSKEISEVSSR